MIRKINLGDEIVQVYDVNTFPISAMPAHMQRKNNRSQSRFKYRLEFGAFDI